MDEDKINKVKIENIPDKVNVVIDNELNIKGKNILRDPRFWISGIVPTIAIILSLILSIFAAYYSVPYLQKSKVDGTIVAVFRSGSADYPYTEMDGSKRNISGTNYYIRVLFSVKNKDFHFKDLDVSVKYKDNDDEHDAEVVAVIPILVSDIPGVSICGEIPLEEDITTTNILQKDSSNPFWIQFILPKGTEDVKKLRQIKTIKLIFKDMNNEGRIVLLDYENIDAKKMHSARICK